MYIFFIGSLDVIWLNEFVIKYSLGKTLFNNMIVDMYKLT